MKLKKIDAALLAVLFTLIALEFFVNSSELSHYQVVIGVIIGFSLGFKLSAVHGSTVSREAIRFAKDKDTIASNLSDERVRLEQGFELELTRKQKLIDTLQNNLRDRDMEVKELVKKLEDLNRGD